ncbi:glycosyltransferase [Demequina sp. SO4-13]|uniref:glycosyltransferase n=1 Tax=Demequina sp. SO4-13 TaxID=3401027 RepID=UPI003AF5C419
MRVLVWNAHGGWADAFVRGDHRYLLPVALDGSGGRAWRDWPESASDVPERDVAAAEPDVVVLQRLEEIAWVEELTGRRPGRDIPAVFVEHNTPRVDVPSTVHPLADQARIPIVHVTHFNALMWDCGRAPTRVIEHGIVDPGHLYSGSLARAAVVINEPRRRWRVTGTDLLPALCRAAPLDVYGMGIPGLVDHLGAVEGEIVEVGELHTDELHREVADRRVYVHPNRWTSLGLALLEAMHLGLPVVGVDTTEIRRAVPPEAGVLSNDVEELRRGLERLVSDPVEASRRGAAAREHVLAHYSLSRFLEEWNTALEDATSASSSP